MYACAFLSLCFVELCIIYFHPNACMFSIWTHMCRWHMKTINSIERNSRREKKSWENVFIVCREFVGLDLANCPIFCDAGRRGRQRLEGKTEKILKIMSFALWNFLRMIRNKFRKEIKFISKSPGRTQRIGSSCFALKRLRRWKEKKRCFMSFVFCNEFSVFLLCKLCGLGN